LSQDTVVVRGRRAPGHENRPLVFPIYQSATFEAADMEEQVRLREGDSFYTRYGNPTLTAAEAAIAELEGAEDALVFSSGMGAITSAFTAVLRAGDHVVAQRALYGGTYEFFLHWFPRLGLQVTFVESGEIPEFASALRPNTKLIYLESPSNPLLQLVPLEGVAALARKERLLSFIDNTFASPINQRPHRLGIDVVLHSATKFLSGHSDLICGAVTGRRQLVQDIRTARRVWGGVMDPHAAWLLLRGLKTLAVRVERRTETHFGRHSFSSTIPG